MRCIAIAFPNCCRGVLLAVVWGTVRAPISRLSGDTSQNIYIYIYTDCSGGEDNILGGHNIGHSKQKVYMYMCPIPNGFRDRVISLCICKIIDKKEILRTDIYWSSDKVGTVYLV
jgi:hypothetical protein